MRGRSFLATALLAVAMIWAGSAQAQNPLVQSNILNASGASSQADYLISGYNVGRYTINWVVTATVSACTVIVEAGADGVTYGTTESTSTCTSSGEATSMDSTARAHVRVRFSSLTVSGGGSVKFTLTMQPDTLNTTQLFGGVAPSILTGGPLPITGNAAASGTTFWADTGNPACGTTGSACASTGVNSTGIANQLWYTQIYIPHNFVITNVAFLCGATCTTDKGVIGIWSTAGTLLACTSTTAGGGTTLSTASTWQKYTLSASCPNGATTLSVIGPTHLIIGVITNGTTAGSIQTYAPVGGAVCAVASSQATLASFTPAVTSTAASCPYIYVN